MTCLWLCFVTIFVILIEINGLRRVNDFDSFQSDLNSDGRPILRVGADNSDNLNLNSDGRPILRVGPNDSTDNPINGVRKLNDSESFRPDLNSNGRPILRVGGADDSTPTVNLNSNTGGQPILPRGMNSFVDDVNLEVNLHFQPIEKRKNKGVPPKNNKVQPVQKFPIKLQDTKSFLRKRLITSSAESVSVEDYGLTIMRTVMPDVSTENSEDGSNEEQIISLTDEENSSGEQSSNSVKSEESDGDYERQHKETKKIPEWTKDLKKYIKLLSTKYERNGMLDHIKPVVKVLERTHKVKIKDIDVSTRGQVKVTYKKGK